MEPDSVNPTLFGVELIKVEVPLIEITAIQCRDYTDRNWVSVVERIFRDGCIKLRRKKREQETKVNWSKEGF